MKLKSSIIFASNALLLFSFVTEPPLDIYGVLKNFMHMHIKLDEPQIAAHVDDIELDGKGLLFLPKDFISN